MNFSELVILLRADLVRLDPSGVRANWWKLISPRFVPVLVVRLSRYCFLSRGLRIFSPFLTWFNVVIFGLEFTPRCEVAAGLMLPHTVGTVVGASKIGRNATLFQGVTLGAKFADIRFTPATRPVVGDDVTIGAGAKVLGGISIGAGAVVAANSLVLIDVEPGFLAIGVPATSHLARA